MLIQLAVDAARWPGIFGWLYRATTGNFFAAFVIGIPTIFVAGREWTKHKRQVRAAEKRAKEAIERTAAHEKWQAEATMQMFERHMGFKHRDHPTHGDLSNSEGATSVVGAGVTGAGVSPNSERSSLAPSGDEQ